MVQKSCNTSLSKKLLFTILTRIVMSFRILVTIDRKVVTIFRKFNLVIAVESLVQE